MNPCSTGLERLPSSWRIVPLKAVASYEVSNVDKHSHSDELPVRLCNYTDVYKNDRITLDMDLMRATATEDEISKFHLEVDDVVITKDSETWNDIAVPALIAETDDDLVCGYHLAILRAMPHVLSGKYLMRAVQSRPVALQLELASTGVTRCGLPKGAIGSAKIPLPDLPTQRRITSYLDRETARIDALVAEKERMLALLEQKRAALISRVVTRGLNPKAPTKPTGFEWLPTIPAHWRLAKMGRLFSQVKRLGFPDEEVLSVYREYGVVIRSDRDDNANRVPEDLSKYQLVRKGDLVINKMKAWQGSLGISDYDGITSPDYVVFTPQHQENPLFLHLLLRVDRMKAVYHSMSNGIRTNQWRIEPDRFLSFHLYLPPLDEQQEIVAQVKTQTEKSRSLGNVLRDSVALLKERRSALITAAVTGKISVNEMTT